MLFVFELPKGQDKFEEYGSPNPMMKEQPKVLHEISLRMKCKANTKYIIVPSTRVPEEAGKFSMSFYTDAGMLDFDVKRVDDPTNRYNFIMEEYEKAVARVPKWKVQKAKENLDTMIGADASLMKTQKTLKTKKTVREQTKRQKTLMKRGTT
jgi:hypothetical protein